MFKLIRQFARYLKHVRLQIVVGLLLMLLSSVLAGANIGLIYPFFKGVFLRGPAQPVQVLQESGRTTVQEQQAGGRQVEGRPAASPPESKPADPVKPGGEDLFEAAGELASGSWQALRGGGGLMERKDRLAMRFGEFIDSHSRLSVLMLLCVLAVALASAKLVVLYLYRACIIHVEQVLIRELRNDLFQHIQGLSLDFLHRFRPGEIISRLINDVMVVRSLCIIKVADLALHILLCLVYFSLALFIDWRMILLSIVVLAPAVMCFQMIGRKLRSYSRRAQEQISRVSDRLAENIQGFRVVQAFYARDWEIGRFKEATQSYFHRMRKLELVATLALPFGEYASTLIAVFILWYGGTRVLAETATLSGPAFLTFLAALMAMLHPLKIAASNWNDLQKGSGAGDRLLEILALRPTIREAKHPYPVEDFREELRLKGVDFSHGERPVLRNIHFSLKRGEFVALVGASGSGKTTLANLLLRLYDPTAGRIELDRRDIREYRLGEYRRLFGMVGQDTWLFEMSVAQNVCYPERCGDPEEAGAALALANAEDFVREMGGPEALVKEGGTNLSGGQCQRLAIARAVSRQPEILIFDEATSALDTESERQVQQALDRSVGDRTALVIAHRLSTVIRADRIVCLKDGEIDGVAPHEELLKVSSEYRKLYELQFQV